MKSMIVTSIFTIVVALCAGCTAVPKGSDRGYVNVVEVEWKPPIESPIRYTLSEAFGEVSLRRSVGDIQRESEERELKFHHWEKVTRWLNQSGYWDESVKNRSVPTVDGQTYKTRVVLGDRDKSVLQHGEIDVCVYDLYERMDAIWK